MSKQADYQARQFYPWLIWGLGAAFFFSEYFARVAPSIMVPQLMQTFQASALAIGSIAGFFYYAYISMQLLVGVLVDRFGPHRLLTLTAGICALGCFLFAVSHSLHLAQFSRLLMGFGAAFAFVGTLKLATIWFPANRFGLLAGLTQALGMLGAAVGEGPLATLVTHMGWRETMWLIGGILLLLTLLMGLFVRDKPTSKSEMYQAPSSPMSLKSSLLLVSRNPQTWINALASGFLYAPSAIFAELWGVSYLVHVYGIHTHVAAMAVSTIFVGWAVGGPFFGWLSDRIKLRRPIVVGSAILSLLFIGIALYVPKMPLPMLFTTLFLYGMSNTGVATTYAISTELNPREVAGTSVAFTNMGSILIGALFQPIVGWFLDLQWTGHMQNGLRVYSGLAFKNALIVLPIFCLLALVFALLTKETHCRIIKVSE